MVRALGTSLRINIDSVFFLFQYQKQERPKNEFNQGVYMRIDFPSPENWHRANSEATPFLGPLPDGAKAELYQGLGHALYDITEGLKQFYGHKKKVAFIPFGSAWLEPIMGIFYREGFEVLVFREPNKNQDNIEAWIRSLPADTLAVYYAKDHPFTGEILIPFDLAQINHNRRIPSIEICHTLHLTQELPLYGFHLQLRFYNSTFCVLIKGARSKFLPQSAIYLSWPSFDPEAILAEYNQEEKELIEDFERNLPHPVQAYFNGSLRRVFDRAVVDLKDMSGDFFIQQFWQTSTEERANAAIQNLVARMDKNLLLYTSHFCSHPGPISLNWWGPNQDPDNLTGLVQISAALVKVPGFKTIFDAVVSTCLNKIKTL